ncbi:OLC1v1039099C1 [Oldenlandia corymbosa var. corymbosa]|uniref:OLC1v1039099C1 n=1 Tax=Oldenlandia corymbosa var. corymbosa TaxID=529605 RepID=A0AAV1D1S6_OLDCO|nr:OLC1v1039099C1 [Oldenlandia corymbosa var. corymbosa]
MESCIDFLECLETDMVLNILKCMDDPADLLRASIVSRGWRDFVVANKLSKILCVGRFPQLANVVDVAEFNCKKTVSTDVGSSSSSEREILSSDHKAFASLLHTLTKLIPSPTECIKEAFSASSTDNYPDESVVHTLDPRDRFARRASYWSSKGQKDPSVPETLIYKLKSDFCVITEIDIQPFEAFFQMGYPIYSANSVRFRFGHPKSINEVENFESLEGPADDKFIWTYTSPKFPMVQENRLQHFKFPEPVLCMGGFLLVELLGRVQRQEMDGLFYICIAHVKVLGQPLSPAFNVEVVEPSGKFVLKYFPELLPQTLLSASKDREQEAAPTHLVASEEMLWGHVGLLEYLVGGGLEEDDDDEAGGWDEENEMDQFIL